MLKCVRLLTREWLVSAVGTRRPSPLTFGVQDSTEDRKAGAFWGWDSDKRETERWEKRHIGHVSQTERRTSALPSPSHCSTTGNTEVKTDVIQPTTDAEVSWIEQSAGAPTSSGKWLLLEQAACRGWTRWTNWRGFHRPCHPRFLCLSLALLRCDSRKWCTFRSHDVIFFFFKGVHREGLGGGEKWGHKLPESE